MQPQVAHAQFSSSKLILAFKLVSIGLPSRIAGLNFQLITACTAARSKMPLGCGLQGLGVAHAAILADDVLHDHPALEALLLRAHRVLGVDAHLRYRVAIGPDWTARPPPPPAPSPIPLPEPE